MKKEDVEGFIRELADLTDENFFGTDGEVGFYQLVCNERNKRLQIHANKNLSTMRKKGGVDAK